MNNITNNLITGTLYELRAKYRSKKDSLVYAVQYHEKIEKTLATANLRERETAIEAQQAHEQFLALYKDYKAMGGLETINP